VSIARRALAGTTLSSAYDREGSPSVRQTTRRIRRHESGNILSNEEFDELNKQRMSDKGSDADGW
jgi:hypothetical protein